MRRSWLVAWAVTAAALAIILYTCLQAQPGAGLLAYAAYAFAPYLAVLAMGRWIRDPWVVGGAGVSALAAEIGLRLAVFGYPRGSTAAVALVFSPLAIAVAVLPVGGLLGLASGWVWRSSGAAIRAGVILFWLGGAALVILGLVRPELLPTAVLHRRAALGRIGPPRVATGAGAFQTTVVAERTGWFQAADLDGRPGDEVAVVDAGGADLLDSSSFETIGRIEFRGRMPRLWNGYSRLVRIDGQVAIVQTGGGFSETEVLSPRGERLWRYRPDPQLPPTALVPADLDGDGRVELYASSTRSIARLDGAGHLIWRRSEIMPRLLALAPRQAGLPAWVVSGSGGHVTVWDEEGHRLARPQVPPDREVVAAVDWAGTRMLLVGGQSLTGLDLGGRRIVEVPLGDFSVTQAVTVRFDPGQLPRLALTAAAPRGVARWKLAVVGPDRRLLYDEVLAEPVSLLSARCADGSDRLLVVRGGELAWLRPRP